MRTTQDHAHGGDPGLVGRTLTHTLLHARAALPPAQNGRPVAPSSNYVAQVRKEMATERSREFQRIWAVCQCDLKDGVPLPLVTAALRQMLTMLEVESVAQIAERRENTPRVLPVLLRNETRAQGRLDVAQIRVLETPDCPNALQDVLHETDRYLSALDPFTRVVTSLYHRVRHVAQPDGLRMLK